MPQTANIEMQLKYSQGMQSLAAPAKKTEVKGFGPVLWAIDPHEENRGKIDSLFRLAKLWCGGDYGSVTPISVLSLMQLGWPARVPKDLKKKFETNALNQVIKLTKRLQDNSLNKPKVIIDPSNSIRRLVAALIEQSKVNKAKVILVRAQTSGARRLTGVGSFTEFLIALSPLPVLVLGNKAEVPQQFSKILFATDLSDSSKKAFQKIIEMAVGFGSEVILFHHFDPYLPPVTYAGFGIAAQAGWPEQIRQQQVLDIKKTANQWISEAKKSKVSCSLHLDEELGTLSGRMLEAAKDREVDLVTLAVKRGPVNQALFGRAARVVMSDAHCPVLLMHVKG